VALAMVLAGARADEILACLRARPAAQDRSNSGDYCSRTLRSASRFAKEHYARARIVRVAIAKDSSSLSFG
jgi:hypothetical protein